MHSSQLLIALAIGVIVGLIIYWWNPSALQNDTGEPNLLWVFLIALAIAVVVYWFLASNGYEML